MAEPGFTELGMAFSAQDGRRILEESC
jgi:hypothetical protein